jgi:hypothetical protein
VFLVSGTNFTEMLAANDWKQFQSRLRYTLHFYVILGYCNIGLLQYMVIAISGYCNIGLLLYRVIAYRVIATSGYCISGFCISGFCLRGQRGAKYRVFDISGF